MSEIEKMYENAVVYDFRYDCNVSFADGDFGCITNCSKGEVKDYCTDKKYFKGAKVIKIKHLYPPFTAEKQIELIKWLARHNFVVCKNLGGWHTGINPTYDEDFGITCSKRATNYGSFEYALASLINNIWQDLTEEEQQQVKGILE